MTVTFVLTHCQTELVKYLTIDQLQFKLECVLFMHLAYPNQIPTSDSSLSVFFAKHER